MKETVQNMYEFNDTPLKNFRLTLSSYVEVSGSNLDPGTGSFDFFVVFSVT